MYSYQKDSTEKSIGYDISAAFYCVILVRAKEIVLTTPVISVLVGCMPKSLVFKTGSEAIYWSGVRFIGSDYRGEIGVVPFHHSTQDFTSNSM